MDGKLIQYLLFSRSCENGESEPGFNIIPSFVSGSDWLDLTTNRDGVKMENFTLR